MLSILSWFFHLTFFKKLFQEHYQVSNGWGRDQARGSVRPDLGHQQQTTKFAAGKQRDKQPMIERLNWAYKMNAHMTGI